MQYFFRFSSLVKITLPIFAALFMGINRMEGQRYVTAAGFRIGQGFDMTLQQYITQGWTAEGIIHTSLGSDELGLTLMGEKHQKIFFRGFNVYAGGGLHYYAQDIDGRSSTNDTENVLGLSMIAGVELSIARLNMSVDLKPDINFNSSNAFDWNGPALSLRYIIIKRERKGIDDWQVWDRFKRKKNTSTKRKKRFWES